LLLDTGKGNNLINFKDTKSSTVEIMAPDFKTLVAKAEKMDKLEVYEILPDLDDEEIDLQLLNRHGDFSSKWSFLSYYKSKLKANQILVYNKENYKKAIKNVGKKAKTALEETGVNIAYIAFGFINWKEGADVYHAPLLLAPISIENESPLKPFYIKITDSDLVINPTFAYKMHHEYNITLPDYEEDGVLEYVDRVKELLKDLGWDISLECKIGVFSFLKINMYKDVTENKEKISKSQNVLRLMKQGEPVDYSHLVTDTENSEFFNVVDADSSQLTAIDMARKGASFILQGPPGTGKSQTITNIIAECLSQGKKVLFVSEKLAALNVVFDKLKKAGLEDFCLELHSHKANKKEFIAELYETLVKNKSVFNKELNAEIEDKNIAKEKLTSYVAKLHQKEPIINLSLYEILKKLDRVKNAKALDYFIKDLATKGEDYILKTTQNLTECEDFLAEFGQNYTNYCWYGYTKMEYSYELSLETKNLLMSTISYLKKLISINEKLISKLKVYGRNVEELKGYYKIFALLRNAKFITPSLLNLACLTDTIEKVEKLEEISKKVLEGKSILDSIFNREIYSINGNGYLVELSYNHNNFFKRIFSKRYKTIKTDVTLCLKDFKKLKYDELVHHVNRLKTYQSDLDEFNSIQAELKCSFTTEYAGVNTDFNLLLNELYDLEEILLNNEFLQEFYRGTQDEFLLDRTFFGEIYNLLDKEYSLNQNAFDNLVSRFNKDIHDFNLSDLTTSLLKCEKCLEDLSRLSSWTRFVKLLNTLEKTGVREYLDLYLSKKMGARLLAECYQKVFYTQWADKIIGESEVLESLTRFFHDDAVKIFKNKEEFQFEINKSIIRDRLSSKRPSIDLVAPNSMVSQLIAENKKQRRKKGIRTLLQDIQELIFILKPCFLMSPLSVSTYLSANIEFDVVIFDEASQIFPQDAIGAIYRGKQLIIVGDSKQMPPSNFFNTVASVDEDEEDDFVSDFESILDIGATVFPQFRLNWHYRSNYEQLIAFSNKNFYDGGLVTFPSCKSDELDIGVDYYHVDGIYDRTKRNNKIEAEKVVDLIYENIEKYPNRSLGVVAFSISQQNLIEYLLTKRRRLNPDKECFFSSTNKEPFFIKNLETVQGDERDTIIFSIGYARDASGKLYLNFGPLNREGGERRLNVAVTRAKHNVKVVSSLRHGDIDLSKTESKGVKLLKEYLEYAELGAETTIRLEEDLHLEDLGYEIEVYNFLRQRGLDVELQLGCSSSKITLALKNRGCKDYFMAVECDGDAYRESKNTRDRDRLRQAVLEKMGWSYYRIWATDWFRNPKKEQENLLKAIKISLAGISLKEDCYHAPTETEKENHFAFPTYNYVDVLEASNRLRYRVPLVIKEIVNLEAPILEEWLIKRMLPILGGGDRVTTITKQQFEYYFSSCNIF
ncbi:MAG: DUF4011 domain-containing protein, partial [Clostridia bacterium]|nr:DUF4011 domain-containing protein [Clostridia bacterium]